MNLIDQDNMINWRFSRRLGEQHPDAHYANPIEGPGPSALRTAKLAFWGLWLGLILAVGATLAALAFGA